MRDKRKWLEEANPSFDDPNSFNDKSKTISQNGILSILGKNIGLLSRKHKKDKQKKYEKSDSKPKNKIKISKFLQFQKPCENKVTSVKTNKNKKGIQTTVKDNPNSSINTSKVTPSKTSKFRNNECHNPMKSIISNKRHNKSVKDPTSGDRGGTAAGNSDKISLTKNKNYRQNKTQAFKSSKPAVEQRVTKSKLRKSSSDSALNVTRGRPQSSSSSSRPQSTLTSRCSSRTTLTSCTSSKTNTPQAKKKYTARKHPAKKKKKTGSPESPDSGHGSSGSSGSPPVVFVNYRYQVRAGAGQRQIRSCFIAVTSYRLR